MSQALRKVTKQISTRIKHTKSMEVRLENHLATPIMSQEQPDSINHMFSNPPSNTYIGREEVGGLMLGLVRQILEILHLTMRPEEVFIVFYTSVFEPVGQEP
jgi:hypothetical protein